MYIYMYMFCLCVRYANIHVQIYIIYSIIFNKKTMPGLKLFILEHLPKCTILGG